MRYILIIVAILGFLLITTPSINSAHSSLQQEYSVTKPSIGNISFSQDNFTKTIFFEYGAELGVLQPPWDYSWGSGIRRVDNAYVRTGTKSIYMYQKSAPKKDAERRVHLVEYQSVNGQYDVYFSWWVYFDNQWLNSDQQGWGTTLGGYQSFFGPPDNNWRWFTAGRFQISPTNRRVVFGFGFHTFPSEEAQSIAEKVTTTYDIKDHVDQWNHFQVYVKWATTYTGIVRAWFNDNLVFEKTGIKTDPSGYPEFSSYNSVFALLPFPDLRIELYQAETSFESWIWVDDVVAALEKVPESYGVYK